MKNTWPLTLVLALCVTSAIDLEARIGNLRFPIDVDLEEILGRGDSNNDGRVNISDTSFLCLYLFAGGQEPPCLNQADVDDNGRVDLSDIIYLNSWLFGGGASPPSPGPFNQHCTPDLTLPNLSCEAGCGSYLSD